MMRARTVAEARRRMPPLVLAACLGLLVWPGCGSSDERELSPEDYLGILRQLGSYDRTVVEESVRQIMRHPRAPTVAALQTTLREGQWDLRVKVQIARILAVWPDPQTGQVDRAGLPEFIEGLRCPESDLREISGALLPVFGAEVVPHVADVLASGQKANRYAACEVLGAILRESQDRGAGEALRDRIMKEEDREIRMLLVINLALWKSREAIEGFINALTDPDEGCREYAWMEIKKREKPPVEFDWRGTVGQRSDAVQKLRSWWSKTTNRS
ncbi:MAG TPA: hypothetical protein DCM87_12445 [Planctomycetes bacterium]|jgi:hypothetical protein|nr:hypothetical protein [Planctomycetota bacterium]